MSWFFRMGIYAFPLCLLALLVVGLIVTRAVQALGAGGARRPAAQDLNPILFWGAVAAVLGFLGQYHGMYNGLRAIAAADALSPYIIAQGLAESFLTTIFGLTTLVVAALAWFGLGALQRRRAGGGGA